MKYFRVYYGWGKDDFLSIPETELSKAIKAQITGMVALLEGGSLSGSEIKKIIPDYQREMGWNREYQLGYEDYQEIGDAKRKDFENVFLIAKTNTERAISGLPPVTSIEPSVEAKQLADKFKIND